MRRTAGAIIPVKLGRHRNVLEPPVTAFDLKPTPLTQPFWDAARDGKLLVQECSACKQRFFRPELACVHCGSRDWSWRQSPGLGTLYSFSVMHRAPSPAFKTPFIFAIVAMDDGWTMFSNLIGLEIEDAAIGMALEVCFHTLDGGLTIPLFKPGAQR